MERIFIPMNKNIKNWVVGIIIVIVALLLIWMVMGRNKKEVLEPTNTPNKENKADHNNMNQNNINQNNPNNTDANGLDKNTYLSRYQKKPEAIMTDMMEAMLAISQSSNASIDFLTGMIPHHESAIAMVESYLKYGGEKEELE